VSPGQTEKSMSTTASSTIRSSTTPRIPQQRRPVADAQPVDDNPVVDSPAEDSTVALVSVRPRRTLTRGLTLVAPTLAALATLGTVPAAEAAPAASAAQVSVAQPAVVRGCGAFAGAKTLGYYYADASVRVYACGIRPSFDGARNGSGPVVRPYAGSLTYYRGYQCIELVARYLKARFNADPGKANGAQAVDRYAAAYPARFVKIANGTRNKAPRKGDVLSLSTNRSFSDVGHTGVVISSSVNAAGNGWVRAIEQNWGGTGGTSGFHTYPVRSWRVVYTGMPHIKWLRSR
jgi:hypothetical protein